jgi:hypothetical protein
VRDLYEEGKKVDKEVFKEDIRLSDQRIEGKIHLPVF